MEEDEKRPASGVRSVHNALRILERLAEVQPVGVSELSRQLGLPKSSTFRSLRTLQQAGWVRADSSETPRWVLATKVYSIGVAASVEGNIRERAVVEMIAMRDVFGETVHLSVPDEDDLIIVARVDGNNPLRTFLKLGTRAPLHATAGGRAILGAMADPAVDSVLDRGIKAYTDQTRLDKETVWAEIRDARIRGFSINSAEWRQGVAAVGSPIVSPSGEVLGALSISMPMTRFEQTSHHEAGVLTAEACRRISLDLEGATDLT